MLVRLASFSFLFLSCMAGVATAPAPGLARQASPASHRSLRPTSHGDGEGKFVHAVSRIAAHPVFLFRA